jgi:NADPH:quinone reductase-like Zn-dependent oxidoreductase
MSRVVRFYEVGEPEVLRIEEHEVRAPQPGEARVRIRAIGLNRAEAAFRRGRYLEDPKLPSGLGYEASGTVESVGAGASDFKAGDEVSIIPSFSMNDYAVYGEFVVVPASALVAKPARLSFEEAASVWMQYLTAWGPIVDIVSVKAGEAVLINAASSSVGLAAIQIVNALGGISIALTRTSAKRGDLERAGAAHVIATTEQDVPAEVKRIMGDVGARLAFDPVGGPDVEKLVKALGYHGTLVIYGGLSGQPTPFPQRTGMGKGFTMRAFTIFEIVRDPKLFAAAKAYVLAGLENGSLRPQIAKTFSFDEIVAAHRYLESNQQVGKVVVTVP